MNNNCEVINTHMRNWYHSGKVVGWLFILFFYSFNSCNIWLSNNSLASCGSADKSDEKEIYAVPSNHCE